jgi:hypothetical protein
MLLTLLFGGRHLTDADHGLLVVRALVDACQLLGALCAVLFIPLLIRANAARLLVGLVFLAFGVGVWMTAWFPPWSLWPYCGASLVLFTAVILTSRSASLRRRITAREGDQSWFRVEFAIAAVATALATIGVGRGVEA